MKVELKDRMKIAMNAKNMKAADLCERTGIPKSAMSYYLNGRSEPKTDRLYIIAKALDVSEAWLLGYDVAMDRSQEQKDIDELAAMTARLQKDREFRQIVVKLNGLNPQQLAIVVSMMDQFRKE